MTSEAGSAWTLVMSYALKNKDMKQAREVMQHDAPLNEHSPNWNLYRISLAQMTHLKSQSTHWRTTCSFPAYKVDYTDYVRAKFTDFDILTFSGEGIFKKVEYVNICGHQCAQCTLFPFKVLFRARTILVPIQGTLTKSFVVVQVFSLQPTGGLVDICKHIKRVRNSSCYI